MEGSEQRGVTGASCPSAPVFFLAATEAGEDGASLSRPGLRGSVLRPAVAPPSANSNATADGYGRNHVPCTGDFEEVRDRRIAGDEDDEKN